MKNFLYSLQADRLRLSKTWFYPLHLLIPLIGAAAFAGYAAISSYTTARLFSVFMQLIALLFPLAAAFMSDMAVKQELEAGSGYFLLAGLPSRATPFASKLLHLAISALFSSELAACGFGLALYWVRPADALPLPFFAVGAMVIGFSAISLYVIHFYLALRFGRGANLGVGVAELLLAFLLITGLGDGIWFAFPSAWGARFFLMESALSAQTAPQNMLLFYQKELHTGSLFALGITTLLLIGFFLWCHHWEGRKSEE